MFLFKRRYRCIICDGYREGLQFKYIHKGIGICSRCFAEFDKGKDKSYPAKAPVDYVLAPLCYEGKIRDAVRKYKFAGQIEYGKVFGELIACELSDDVMLSNFDLVIPVPLYDKRRIERGYNQSEIISEALAQRLGLPLETECLFRTRETKRQSGLLGAERVENVKGAFFAADDVRGKNVILVDDIFTMGETMSACATALKEAGANRVAGVVLCKPRERH